jgi:ADP-heptose:LPS heptosyltransferase
MDKTEHILVIKLSALGDFIQALGPMKSIRAHHPAAKITLLTTKAFAQFGADCGYFDDVWIDEKPKWFNLSGWSHLSRRLNQTAFTRVYDLQNNDRSRIYFKLFRAANRPQWVGTVKSGSHYNGASERTKGTAFDGHSQTLALAGIKNVTIDPLEWMDSDISALGLDLNAPYALIVAGCAPSRPEKRWPAQNFAALAQKLVQKNIQPVLIGTKSEQKINAEIKATCPEAIDLTDKTTINQIGTLGRAAALCITNDTGPAHIISVTGCPSYVLFSTQGSDPNKHAPLGHNVQKFINDDITKINADLIWQAIEADLESSH